jgi:hypothetical protein
LIRLLLTSAVALSVKRQNDTPDCVDGDTVNVHEQGPYASGQLIAVSFFLFEEQGLKNTQIVIAWMFVSLRNRLLGGRAGLLCKKFCNGVVIPGAFTEWICQGVP